MANEQYERIKVFTKYENGRTVCMCVRDRKKCNGDCTKETVYRDRYAGWQSCFRQDKYGKGGEQ